MTSKKQETLVLRHLNETKVVLNEDILTVKHVKEDQNINGEKMKSEGAKLWGSCRLYVAIMCFFVILIMMFIRFSLSISLVCMTTTSEDHKSPDNASSSSLIGSFSGHLNISELKDDQIDPPSDSPQQECVEKAEFSHWSKRVQTQILGSFFYGYILTQIAGGWICHVVGAKRALLMGILVLSLGSVLSPFGVRLANEQASVNKGELTSLKFVGVVDNETTYHTAAAQPSNETASNNGFHLKDYHLLMFIRFIEGFFSGIAFPTIYQFLGIWISVKERASIMSLVFAGIPLSNVVNFPFNSMLCASGLDGGWPLTFYIPGVAGLIWCLIFALTVHDHPHHHPKISENEKKHILGDSVYAASLQDRLERDRSCSSKEKKVPIPILKMLLSMPGLCLCVTHICSAFGYYLIALALPLYISEVFHLDIVLNGLYSSVPHIGLLTMFWMGHLFDFIRHNFSIRLLNLRKIFNSIGFFVPTLILMVLYVIPVMSESGNMSKEDTDRYSILAILLPGASIAFHQFALGGGFYFSHADIAGNFSGVMFGITNTCAQLAAIAIPFIINSLTQDKSFNGWRNVFFVSGGVNVVGGVVFNIFASDQLQSWAEEKSMVSKHSSPSKAENVGVVGEKKKLWYNLIC